MTPPSEKDRDVAARFLRMAAEPPQAWQVGWCAKLISEVRAEARAEERRSTAAEIVAFLREQDEHNAADEINREWLR